MKGLPNVGHTCYFNAALQCLLYCANMTNYFLAGADAQDACKKKKLASALGLAYGEMARDYWRRGGVGTADPAAVREAFVKACRGFAPQRQHDAHEAMVCLLDRLHDGLSRLKPGAAAVAACPGVRGDAWAADLKGSCSVVSEVFRGQVEQTVRAEGYTSTTCDHFTSLSLAVKDATSLSQCLQRHMADETVPDFKVGDRQVAARLTRRFTYLPRILVIHLKRFDSTGAKIDRFIDYPAELDMGEYTAPECGRHYQLFAVCLHRGAEAGGGHYAALGEVKGVWFEMDDDSARRLEDINNVIQRDAYVLLYRRL